MYRGWAALTILAALQATQAVKLVDAEFEEQQLAQVLTTGQEGLFDALSGAA